MPGFVKNLDSVIGTATTAAGNAEAVAQLIQVVRAVCGGPADVPVSNGVADADVHSAADPVAMTMS